MISCQTNPGKRRGEGEGEWGEERKRLVDAE
jgi:hypothetical protein